MTFLFLPASLPGLAAAIGYLLTGGLFVFSGIDHFARVAAVRAMLAARGWPLPGPLLAVASVLGVVAGLGLALRIARPWAALPLAAFTVAASLLLLDFWRSAGPEREAMRSGFLVNAGLVGGLLLAFAGGLQENRLVPSSGNPAAVANAPDGVRSPAPGRDDAAVASDGAPSEEPR